MVAARKRRLGSPGALLAITVASVLLIALTGLAVAVSGSAHAFAVRVVCAVALVGMAVFLAVGLDRALVSNTVLAVVFGVPAVLVVVSAVLARRPGTRGAVAPAH